MSVWGLPGGSIEIDETIQQALIREFQEETGLTVKVKDFIDISEAYFISAKGAVHSIMLLYAVEEISGDLLVDGNGDDTGENIFVPVNSLTEDVMQWAHQPFLKYFK